MRQMTLDLDKSQQRPVVMLGNGLKALLDTGAYIPVWVGGEETLIGGLGAELVKKNISFTGFGGTAYGNLYKVTIQVGDLYYPNMHIIASNEFDVPFHIILSATMFSHLIYEIDDHNHKFNITVPDQKSVVRNLNIVDRNGRPYVLCNSEQEIN
mgnify:CR=1 FL=1